MSDNNVIRFDGGKPVNRRQTRGLASGGAAPPRSRGNRGQEATREDHEAVMEALSTPPKGKRQNRATTTVERPSTYKRATAEEKALRREERARRQARDWPGLIGQAVVTSACAVGAIGLFWVLAATLIPKYGLAGGGLRAVIPPAVDLLAGHWWSETQSKLKKLACALVILAAAATDVDTAGTYAAISKQLHVDEILRSAEQYSRQASPDLSHQTQTAQEGPLRPSHTELQHQKNQEKEIDLEQQHQARTADYTKQRLENAKQGQESDGRIPVEYSLLGAIACASLVTSLKRLLQKAMPT